MRFHRLPIFKLLAILLACGVVAYAQSDRGTVTGTVRDQAGGVVPDAKVTVTNLESGEVRETTTNSEGNFTLPELKAASYRLTVEAAGFKTAAIESMQLAVQTTRRADVTLEAGAISESVTISAGTPCCKPTARCSNSTSPNARCGSCL